MGGLDVLGLQAADLHNLAMFLVFRSHASHGLEPHIRSSAGAFRNFLEKVSKEYVGTNPYHTYTHACDVLASLCRILTMVRWQAWLSDVDVFALLVSAICHDIGHPGYTNIFLVETQGELAMRY